MDSSYLYWFAYYINFLCPTHNKTNQFIPVLPIIQFSLLYFRTCWISVGWNMSKFTTSFTLKQLNQDAVSLRVCLPNVDWTVCIHYLEWPSITSQSVVDWGPDFDWLSVCGPSFDWPTLPPLGQKIEKSSNIGIPFLLMS